MMRACRATRSITCVAALMIGASTASAWATGEPGSAFAHAVKADNPCYVWASVAEQTYKMPKGLMTAIVTQESGGHAYALNVDGKAFLYRTATDAAYAIQQKAPEAFEIDVGCGQLNIRWHGVKFKSLGALLDPHVNISYAAWHLSVLYKQTGNWAKAAGLYHSYDTARNRPYVCSLKKLVQTKAGDDTELAKFCSGATPGLLTASR